MSQESEKPGSYAPLDFLLNSTDDPVIKAKLVDIGINLAQGSAVDDPFRQEVGRAVFGHFKEIGVDKTSEILNNLEDRKPKNI